MKPIVVLVTGGRNYSDKEKVFSVLDRQEAISPFKKLIQGGSKGADYLAWLWARERGVPVLSCPADWHKYGKSAGPIRNQGMLDLKPDLVIAFPGGKGTEDMVGRAKKSGIECIEVE